MKKLFYIIPVLLFLFSHNLFSQRIIFQSDFETGTLSGDSIPTNWAKQDVDGLNPNIGWAIRDTSVRFCASCPTRPQAIGRRSLEIPWYAGNGGNFINNDWAFTHIFSALNGDSLIFDMLIGGIIGFNPTLIDSMQVWVCSDQDPIFTIQKLATIRSLDSNNVWTNHKFNLSSFNGQNICLAFRYYMDVSVDGLWCNIDNIFIGNHSAIGIEPISTEIPAKFSLEQNYPNPFNPNTNIKFSIAKAGYTKLEIFNETGQLVAVPIAEDLKAGYYNYNFNGVNLPSGAYFYRLVSNDFVKTNKMILIK